MDTNLLPYLSDNPPLTTNSLFDEEQERQLAEASLRALLLATSRAKGEDFFYVLVKEMALALDVKFIIAGEIVIENNSESNKTLAIWSGNGFADNFTYSLKDTPCNKVSNQHMCFHACDIQSLYPLDTILVDLEVQSYIGMPMVGTEGTTLGILVAMDTKPITENKRLLALSILSIFSARCAAELQHRNREKELEVLVEKRTMALANARDLLVQKEKLAGLGALVSGIAHAINTPLGNALVASTSVSDYAKELQKIIDSPNVSRVAMVDATLRLNDGAQMVSRNLGRVSELISNFRMLAISQEDEKLSVFNLFDFVTGICIAHQPECLQHNAKITTTIDQQIMVNLPTNLISQIFSHLLMNALLHGFGNSRNGTIQITALAQGNLNQDLLIQIQDDGTGATASVLNRMFEPFFTTNFGHGSAGLGLHVVQTLMQHLGGSIHISSQIDKGLLAKLIFPSCIVPTTSA